MMLILTIRTAREQRRGGGGAGVIGWASGGRDIYGCSWGRISGKLQWADWGGVFAESGWAFGQFLGVRMGMRGVLIRARGLSGVLLRLGSQRADQDLVRPKEKQLEIRRKSGDMRRVDTSDNRSCKTFEHTPYFLKPQTLRPSAATPS